MGNEGAFGCIGLHGAVEELRQNGVTGIGHQNDGEEEIRSNLIFYYFYSSLFLFVLIIFHFFTFNILAYANSSCYFTWHDSFSIK